ncbi:MAG: hypothetical protein H6740_19270 [Alphaproteobacteria bacterium]|nr:hypothetical protein [Alphaproteobacteria bacterium]
MGSLHAGSLRLALVAMWALGCADEAQPLRDALGVEDFAGQGGQEVYPAAGAMALRGPLDVHVQVGDGDAPEVWLRAGLGPERLDCLPGSQPSSLVCPAFEEVPEDQNLTLEIDWGDALLSLPMSGRVPGPGRAWFSEAGPELLALGGNDRAPELLAPYLSGTSMVAVSSAGVGGQALRMGLARAEDAATRVLSPGLVLVTPIEDSQTLAGPVVDGWLPLEIDGETVPLPLQELAITSTREGTLLDARIEAVVPADALAAIAEASGVPEVALRAALDLDVDRDGDGRPDAASILMRLQGEETALTEW